MGRRRFNGGERVALYLAAQGCCARCGVELEKGWHADHMTPFVAGGPTDVINGQALCPTCNLVKGKTMLDPLRQWQIDAIQRFSEWSPTGGNGFLVEGTPGAGKTRVATEIAARLKEAGLIERIIVAVPTSRLETQWGEEFAKQGISINPSYHAGDGRLADDVFGCAVTYAEMVHNAQDFRRLASTVPTLIICDEIHHCGDKHSYGEAVLEAFTPAAFKVLLSGTPFRSKQVNDAMPFVNYIDGTGTPDIRYGYRQALTDGVVRSVFFPRRGGTTEWQWKGKNYSADFDAELNDDEANKRLRTALWADGDWMPSVLADADRQLRELRQTDPSAAGIVFCESIGDAKAVADLLRVLGRSPVVVTSEDKKSDDYIRDFALSHAPWMVSIRKVSEGVDIRRLRVGVYATAYLTELFFRQVVGRLVRTNSQEEDPTAFLYIPDDARLRTMAEEIRNDREHVLNEEDGMFAPGVASGDGDRPDSQWMPIAATAADAGTIFNQDTFTPAELAEADRAKRMDPATANLPTVVVATLFRIRLATSASTVGDQYAFPVALPAVDEPPQFMRVKKLRAKSNVQVKQIVAKGGTDLTYSEVNVVLNKAVGLPGKGGITQASETQLQERIKLAADWLSSGYPPGT